MWWCLPGWGFEFRPRLCVTPKQRNEKRLVSSWKTSATQHRMPLIFAIAVGLAEIGRTTVVSLSVWRGKTRRGSTSRQDCLYSAAITG